MLISRDSAMRIVTEMSSVIHHDINMMDEQGIIIASTDPARVGSFHGGVFKMLQDGLDEIVVQHDGEYEGSREGINLPVLFEGARVGAVGITGKSDEVAQYGRIIKKMTEVLLLDSWAERQKQLRAAMWSQFMEEWLFSASEQISDDLAERGLELGIDIRKPRQVFIVALTGHPDKNVVVGQNLLNRVEEQIHDVVWNQADGFYYKLPFRYVCFVAPCAPDKLQACVEDMRDRIQSCGIQPFIGVDATTSDYWKIREAYCHADKALKAALRSGRLIGYYDDADLEILVSEIPLQVRKDFVQNLFKECSSSELEELLDFLSVYFEASGSIQSTAQELFMHKNTVQYKLRKIEKQTGFDPRDIKNAAVFETALAVYRSLKSSARFDMLHL